MSAYIEIAYRTTTNTPGQYATRKKSVPVSAVRAWEADPDDASRTLAIVDDGRSPQGFTGLTDTTVMETYASFTQGMATASSASGGVVRTDNRMTAQQQTSVGSPS